MSNEFTDLTLNNGQIATFKGVDFWSRPYYTITLGDIIRTVCCTELNGTYLHYYTPRNNTDGEPDYPLPEAYQPVLKLPEDKMLEEP